MVTKIIAYTDGSCSANGKKTATGGIGVHFPNKELRDISKVYRNGYCTNQKTELYAILMCISYIKKNFNLSKIELIIKSDSQYSINCITKWAANWEKNGWIKKDGTPVANRGLIEPIYTHFKKYRIFFEHVEAHTGRKDEDSIGNAKADSLATKATKRAQQEISDSAVSWAANGSSRILVKLISDPVRPR